MKVAVLDYSNSEVAILIAPEGINTNEEVEAWLEKDLYYRLDDIYYMTNVQRQIIK